MRLDSKEHVRVIKTVIREFRQFVVFVSCRYARNFSNSLQPGFILLFRVSKHVWKDFEIRLIRLLLLRTWTVQREFLASNRRCAGIRCLAQLTTIGVEFISFVRFLFPPCLFTTFWHYPWICPLESIYVEREKWAVVSNSEPETSLTKNCISLEPNGTTGRQKRCGIERNKDFHFWETKNLVHWDQRDEVKK